jgi:hypothetical protein
MQPPLTFLADLFEALHFALWFAPDGYNYSDIAKLPQSIFNSLLLRAIKWNALFIKQFA